MARGTSSSAAWEEFDYRGRPFYRGVVPKGDNQGQEFTIAKQVAGRYAVKGFFASGGCGLILRGKDLQTETDVLLKTTLRYDLYHYAQGRDEEGYFNTLRASRRQLQTERRVMVLLKNRGCNGIPNPNDYVFDWNPRLAEPHPDSSWRYSDDDMLSSEPYLVMEHIDGMRLSDAIGNGIEERRALHLMSEVAHVLRVLHTPQVLSGKTWKLVYKDLKTDNILVGTHDAATVLDFGGCRLTVDQSLMENGAFTPGYCPPEIDAANLTPAADTYTFGSTLFQTLTGRPPSEFLRSQLAGTGPKHVSFDHWDWDALKDRVSAPTFQFVQRCLKEAPSERPANGTVLCHELDRLRSAL